MKILIEFSQGASFFVRNSWRRVLEACGHKVYMWAREGKNINDLEAEFGKFDVFLGNTYTIDRSMDKWIRRNPNMKVALFGSNWGELTDKMDSKKYPIVKVTKEEKLILGALYKDIKKPDLIHIHVTPKYLEATMGGWRELGIPIEGILNAGDTFVYKLYKPQEKYKSQVSFVGSRWEYKARTLDKYLGRLCDEEWNRLNIKIFGGGGWDKPQYLGALGEGEDALALASSAICPNVSEQHSPDFGYDIIERCFKVPLCGGLLISDNVASLSEVYINNECPVYNNYNEFKDLIYFYLKNESERTILLNKQRKVILANHTYHHRMSSILKFIGLQKEADKCLSEHQENMRVLAKGLE